MMSVSQSRRFVAPLIISAALLMETMDATVLATALRTIATTLHAPVLSLKVALTTYLVALAAFIPISGWMASDGWHGLLAKTAAGRHRDDWKIAALYTSLQLGPMAWA